jgi:hypothetical protein
MESGDDLSSFHQERNAPVKFSSHIGAGETTSLIVTLRDVPLEFTASGKSTWIVGRMRYNVTYYFDTNNEARRTSKLVEWEVTTALRGVPGESREEMFTKYFDEIEE